MSPRLRAKTQDQQTLMVAWQAIPWKKVHRHVFRLQKRIYQATRCGDVRTVHQLQNLLSKSWYARLLAVRRVTQDNRGRHTAGIDGVKSLTHLRQDKHEFSWRTCRYAAMGSPSGWLALQR